MGTKLWGRTEGKLITSKHDSESTQKQRIIPGATSEQKNEIFGLCDSEDRCSIKISQFEVKASLPYQNIMSNVRLNVRRLHIGRSHKHAYSH